MNMMARALMPGQWFFSRTKRVRPAEIKTDKQPRHRISLAILSPNNFEITMHFVASTLRHGGYSI
jgi:hypothetical protein